MRSNTFDEYVAWENLLPGDMLLDIGHHVMIVSSFDHKNRRISTLWRYSNKVEMNFIFPALKTMPVLSRAWPMIIRSGIILRWKK